MNEPTTITEDTYKKGDVLVKGDAQAVILSVAKHRKSQKFIGFNVDKFSLGNPAPQHVTLFLADLKDPNGWKLQEPLVKPAPTVSKNAPVAPAVATEPEKPMSDDEAAAWDAVRRDMEQETYKRIASEDAAELDPDAKPADPWDVVYAELHGVWNIEYYASGQTMLTREVADRDTAMKIIEGTQQPAPLATEVHIVDASELKIAELRQRNLELLEEKHKLELDKSRLEGQLHDAMERLGKSIPPGMVAPATDTPKVEIKTLVQKIGMPEAAREADTELAVSLNDGWEKWDCSIPSYDAMLRIITLQRHCRPAPVQPQVTAARTVAPSAVMAVPADIPTNAGIQLEAARLTMQHANAAQEESPLIPLSEIIEDAAREAQALYQQHRIPHTPIQSYVGGQRG